MYEKRKNKRFNISLILSLLISVPAVAEVEFLPTSRHQQSLTYGLFIDQQTALVFQSGGRAFGSVGGFISVLEMKDLKWKPQLSIHGLSSASFRINGKGDTLLTDTADARAGLAIDLKFTDDLRGSITWTHQSGHISDNIPETDLIGSNLGNEMLSFRLVKDFDRRVRLGGSLRPFLGTEPKMKAFGADQFIEWFFKGASENKHAFSPFIAAGFEEWGYNFVDLSFHAQIGFAIGNHFDEVRTSSLRTVLGYYTGMDPRLKYYQFKNKRSEFLYAGLMIDL